MLKLVVSHPDPHHVMVKFYDRQHGGDTWAFCGMVNLGPAAWDKLNGVLIVGLEGAPPEYAFAIEHDRPSTNTNPYT